MISDKRQYDTITMKVNINMGMLSWSVRLLVQQSIHKTTTTMMMMIIIMKINKSNHIMLCSRCHVNALLYILATCVVRVELIIQSINQSINQTNKQTTITITTNNITFLRLQFHLLAITKYYHKRFTFERRRSTSTSLYS